MPGGHSTIREAPQSGQGWSLTPYELVADDAFDHAATQKMPTAQVPASPSLLKLTGWSVLLGCVMAAAFLGAFGDRITRTAAATRASARPATTAEMGRAPQATPDPCAKPDTAAPAPAAQAGVSVP